MAVACTWYLLLIWLLYFDWQASPVGKESNIKQLHFLEGDGCDHAESDLNSTWKFYILLLLMSKSEH